MAVWTPKFGHVSLTPRKLAELQELVFFYRGHVDLSSMPIGPGAARVWRKCAWFTIRGLMDIQPSPDMTSTHYVAVVTQLGYVVAGAKPNEETGKPTRVRRKDAFIRRNWRQVVKGPWRAIPRGRRK